VWLASCNDGGSSAAVGAVKVPTQAMAVFTGSSVNFNTSAGTIDRQGNIFLVGYTAGGGEASTQIQEIPYNQGVYGAPIIIRDLGRGLLRGGSIAVDSVGDLFFLSSSAPNIATLQELPYNQGAYSSPITLYTDNNSQLQNVRVDSHGNLFVLKNSTSVIQFLNNQGTYGKPMLIYQSSGDNISAITVDSKDSVFAAGFINSPPNGFNGMVVAIPYKDGKYGAPITVASDSNSKGDNLIAIDDSDNIFVRDEIGLIKKISYNQGTYGTPTPMQLSLPTLNIGMMMLDVNGDMFLGAYNLYEFKYTGYTPSTVNVGTTGLYTSRVAVGINGDLFTQTTAGNVVKIPYNAGTYGTAIPIGGSDPHARGVAVDFLGNVFIADDADGLIKEIPYSQGTYQTPRIIANSADEFSPHFSGIAIDSNRNVFFVDNGGLGFARIREIPYVQGAYTSPITVVSAVSNSISEIAVDNNDNLFVTSDHGNSNNIVAEFQKNAAGYYGSPIIIGSSGKEHFSPRAIAVDGKDNVFVTTDGQQKVEEIPYTGTSYGTRRVIYNSMGSADYLSGVAVDGNGNVFMANGIGSMYKLAKVDTYASTSIVVVKR